MTRVTLTYNETDPERLQQILTEVAQAESLRYETAIKDALENGWLIWKMRSGQQRLQGYMAETVIDDMPLVLTPGYVDLWTAKLAPDLAALAMWNQANLLAQQTGAPITDTSKLFWAMLLPPNLPTFVFRYFADDFISLVKSQLKREVRNGLMVPVQEQHFDVGGTIEAGGLDPMNYGPNGGLPPFPEDGVGQGVPPQVYSGIDVAKHLTLPGGFTNTLNSPQGQGPEFDALYQQHLADAAMQNSPQSKAWLGDLSAPPLNQPVSDRVQAVQQGLSGLGLDPRLASLGGIDQRIYAMPLADIQKQAGTSSIGALYVNTPLTGSKGSIELPQPELNVQRAVQKEDLMHELLHNLETHMGPEEAKQLYMIEKMNPIPPAWDTHHPGGITGYFDAWAGTGGTYQIPQAIKDFINQLVANNYG